MKVTRDMTIKQVLAMNEEKVLDTLEMVSMNFSRLRHKRLRNAMAGRITIEQAAKVARTPLSEVLFVLNLALGMSEADISHELMKEPLSVFEYTNEDPPIKPDQISKISDDDTNLIYLDLLPFHEMKCDPMPAITKVLAKIDTSQKVALLRHPFDPIPLRELFARKGFASWVEERKPGKWYVYFYRPYSTVSVAAMPAVNYRVFSAGV
jgi:hypothetical protein